ncbi:hypothetical protein V1524DRAFT_436891 [Lipomyces starkeyi]
MFSESLVSYLDVREDREMKADILMLYRSQMDELREALRDSREESRQLHQFESQAHRERAQLEIQFQRERADLESKFQRERADFRCERSDLVAERDRALQKTMMLELLHSK